MEKIEETRFLKCATMLRIDLMLLTYGDDTLSAIYFVTKPWDEKSEKKNLWRKNEFCLLRGGWFKTPFHDRRIWGRSSAEGFQIDIDFSLAEIQSV